MRRRLIVIFLIAVILGAALAGSLYWKWSASPRYSLQQMALALKAKDMNKFFNYLDLKAIFNNFLEATNKDLEEPKDKKEDDWTRLSRQMGRKFARFLLPKLFENFEKDIRTLIEKQLLSLDNTQILAIAAAVTTAQIEVKGEEARVTLVDPKSKRPFRFQMLRQPESRTWQIIAVDYQDLRNFCQSEFQGTP